MAKWVVSAKKADFKAIAEKYHIDQVIARIIRNRDVVSDREIEAFLYGDESSLHSPYLLKDVELAADELLKDIGEGKKIRIIGDYDIDGVCSTYILLEGLQLCGADVDTVIPHRIQDGYGLNDHLIKEAHDASIDTILTCDNGIAAYQQVQYANELGMKVIITDHHEVPYDVQGDGTRVECLPNACAIVDPKQSACHYPFEGICGAVVAYKLVTVLLERNPSIAEQVRQKKLEELLAFAAFATIGDVMELRDENRVLVKKGLELLSHTTNPGMKALIDVNELRDKPISVYHVGFVLGPCLNATGRLDAASRALSLFCVKRYEEAVVIANELKELNDSRKAMTLQETQKAIQMIEEDGLLQDKVLVVYLPDCHESLAGIIAGRIRERYYRPVFVLTNAEEGIKGSGRSVEAYHMYDKMSECKELYTKYGGHKLAAGVSMPTENLELFRTYLNEHCDLQEDDLTEKIVIDVPMPLSYITMDLVKQLALLEPFGNGNPKPVFAQKNINVLSGTIIGKNRNVGKFTVQDENGRKMDMMYFGDLEQWNLFLKEKFGEEEQKKLYTSGSDKVVISAIYYPDINQFRGIESLQIIMQDYQ